MINSYQLIILLFFVSVTFYQCFHIQSLKYTNKLKITMHFDEAILGNTALVDGALNRQRYIATNRFKVRPNNGPKFEKRWADRKSRLAQLDGFRFFTLLRRVDDNGNTYESKDDLGNYISFTIWEDKKHFDEWRTGEAFKEAHGGGGITDFIQLLSTALFILNGAPKPAFYDGLLPVINDKIEFESEGGWRKIPADGKNYLPVDLFVTQNKLSIPDNKVAEYEKYIQSKDNKYSGFDGFIGSIIMRRDATKADDSYNYIETALWKNKSSYDNYKTTATPINGNSFLSPDSKPATYEGKLALSSKEGI